MSALTRAGFWAGLVAGGIAAAAIYLGLFTSGIPAVALALWDQVLRVIPLQLFAFFIVRLKFAAKPSAFWAMLAGVVGLGGVLGAALARVRLASAVRSVLAWVVPTGALAVLTYRPAVSMLAARRSAEGAADGSALLVAAAIAGYGFLFAAAYGVLLWLQVSRLPTPARPAASSTAAPSDPRVATPPDGVTRRDIISRALFFAVAATAGATAARWMQILAAQPVATAQSLVARWRTLLPAEITPTDQFYVVSKNPPGFDPRLDAGRWTLEIGGMVDRPLKLTYDQIRAMPAVEQLQTLECISNEVGGDLISNAKWKGVRLRDVLARAGGPGAKAVRVAFHCADGYTESLPLVDALMPTTLLAYEMNGEPLTPAHGFPVRLLVPGLFGMKNPKWITRLTLVDYDFQGYWERIGWSDEAVVKTMSKFTTLERDYRVGQEVPLGGVAYAGGRGIREVDVSTDDGKTWAPAEVKPALGPFTWVLWAAVWKPTGPGQYTLKVRAKDGGGIGQSPRPTPTLPDGAAGYHTLRVRVRK